MKTDIVYTLVKEGEYKGQWKCTDSDTLRVSYSPRVYGYVKDIVIGNSEPKRLGIVTKNLIGKTGVILLKLNSPESLHLLLILDLLQDLKGSFVTFNAYVYDKKNLADVSAYVDKKIPEEPKWINHKDFKIYRNDIRSLLTKVKSKL